MGEIKRAIEVKNKEEKRQDIENSKKVGDRLTDNPTDNSYLTVMPLHLSRDCTRIYSVESAHLVRRRIKSIWKCVRV